jgi:hypothetical protein
VSELPGKVDGHWPGGSSWQTGHFASAIWKFLLGFALIRRFLRWTQIENQTLPRRADTSKLIITESGTSVTHVSGFFHLRQSALQSVRLLFFREDF